MPLVKTAAPTPPPAPLPSSPSAGDAWIMVNKDAIDLVSGGSGGHSPGTPVRHSIQYHCKLLEHSPFALVKCWESLAFIVRNVAHITPYNFESCVRCIRTFVEASMGQTHQHHQQQRDYQAAKKKPGSGKDRQRKLRDGASHQGSGLSSSSSSSLAMDSSDSESEELPERYQSISIQLLDLMHTLHTRTAQIFRWWAEEGGAVPQCSSLWSQGWCPLLQGIARLATDQRRQVRTSAITCLQRALLVQDLQTLTGLEWAGSEPAVLVENISKFLHSSQSDRISRVAAGIGTDASGGEDPSTAAEGASLSEAVSQKLTHEELAAIKRKKRLLTQGTDLFNQRPEKGIQFLQENGLLNPVLDPQEVAQFLRENSGLDKKMIGEYISKKKNVESRILEVYVKSFDFAGLTIDQALRLYLETFRLPGEAPLISLVMEHFADHWHVSGGRKEGSKDFMLYVRFCLSGMQQRTVRQYGCCFPAGVRSDHA